MSLNNHIISPVLILRHILHTSTIQSQQNYSTRPFKKMEMVIYCTIPSGCIIDRATTIIVLRLSSTLHLTRFQIMATFSLNFKLKQLTNFSE